MDFPHSFYEDEIRCDYLIPSMVKRTWAAQIEILSDVDRACRQNGLEYFAEWGTLLGTIRHGGFIPWDDDLDICMKRKDYNRFISNVGSLMSPDHSIVNYRSNREFKQMLSRVVSSDHYRFDPEYMHKYSGLPIALGIDIFPLDFLTDDEEYEKDRERRVNLVYDVVNEIAHFGTDPASLKDYLSGVEKECGTKLDWSKDILTQLRELLERLFGEVDEKDAKYVTLYPLWMNKHRYVFPVEAYKKSVRLPFENTSIPVPVYYDAILKMKYGSSYMTPVRSGGAHEYPYFEQHMKVLRDSFGFEWPTYRFAPADFSERKTDEAGDRTAVFITYSPSAYVNMRRVVRHYIEKGYKVTILPITRYDVAPDMTGITASKETVPDGYYTQGCEGAVVSHDPEIIKDRPAVIVTNYPYDEYNLITAVDKAFYVRALRQCCNRLVYIPPFEAKSVTEADERAKKLMPLYVDTPAPVICDELILCSEEMKTRYVECLCAFSGDSYRDKWEQKITVLSDPAGQQKRPSPSKKKIMFFVGLCAFSEHGIAAIEKIGKVFDIFDNNAEKVEAVYVLQDGLLDNLKELYPSIYERYGANDFRESVYEFDIDDIDAYYGEASSYASIMTDKGKPVMIWNIDI